MVKAIWNDKIIAESDSTVVIEGNHYFPPNSIHWDYLSDSTLHTTCPWKGVASYYDVEVDGQRVADAAWSYPEPKSAAGEIQGHVAFWKGVRVEA